MSQRFFFDVIKSGLNNEKMEYTDEVLKYIGAFKMHNLLQFLYPVFQKEEFKKYHYSAIAFDTNMNEEIKKILKLLSDNKIKHVILKGFYLKNLYPKSHLRTMGDLDLLIDKKDFNKVKKLLLKENFEMGERIFHHTEFHKSQTIIEVHYYLVGLQSGYYKYFLNWQDKIEGIDNFTYKFNDNFHLVYIIAHFAKHMAVGGAGIRSIIDIYLLVTKRNINIDYVKQELEKIKLLEFFYNIVQIIDIMFEYKVCEYNSNPDINLVLKYILSNASTGSLNNVDINYMGKSEGRKLRLYLKRIFISPKEVFVMYPYSKTIILLPVAYIHHALKKIFKFKGSSRKKHLTTITNEQIEAQRDAVKKMGL